MPTVDMDGKEKAPLGEKRGFDIFDARGNDRV